MRACRTFELPSFRKARGQDTKDRSRIIYYHLRYHLWVGVRRDSQGSNDIVTEQKAHKQGANETRWVSTEVRNGWLRIRRPQVRVLPSALLKVLLLQDFCLAVLGCHPPSYHRSYHRVVPRNVFERRRRTPPGIRRSRRESLGSERSPRLCQIIRSAASCAQHPPL